VQPPQPNIGRYHPPLDPAAPGLRQHRVEGDREDRQPHVGVAPLARLETAERNAEQREDQRHDRQPEPPLQLGLQPRVVTREQLLRAHLVQPRRRCGTLGSADRYDLLVEMHDAITVAAGRPLDALAVIERHGLALTIRRDRVMGTARERRLEHRTLVAIHEHVAQVAIRPCRAGVDDDAPAVQIAKLARQQRRHDAGAHRRVAQALLLERGTRRQIEVQPENEQRHRQREQPHRRRHSRDADPTGLRGGHLAVVIETPEGEHDPEQKPHWQQDGDVLRRAQGDQLEHELLLVLQLRGARQHRADLVDQQNREGDDRYTDEVDRHLAQ